jgi:DNA-binding transcriptional MerR regulator
MYTVKQVAELAQVSVRTLHHYDAIGLLRPSQIGANGYRYYDETALLRLQQILFYREIGLELAQIRDILDDPEFDLLAALRSHRALIEERMQRLSHLIGTIDRTISHLAGETIMSGKSLFKGFSEEQQKDYERQARLQYGADTVSTTIRRWNGYTPAQREAIMEESGQIYVDLAAVMTAGKSPLDEDVQAILTRWQDNLRHFYEPTIDIMRGLGYTYGTDPEFMATFQQVHPDLPAFLQAAVTQYVDDLEYAEIARMLEEDEAANHVTG